MRSVLSVVLGMSMVAGLLVAGPVVATTVAAAQTAPASRFIPLPPTRVLDTRTGLGVSGPVGGGQTVTLNLAGRLPANATAAVLNLTGVTPTASTFVTAFPSAATRPAASNLNLARGEIRANLVTVAVGSARAVSLYNNAGNIHLVADLAGYYATSGGGLFTARQAERVLATRVGQTATAVVDLSTLVPASATAVVVNVTGAAGTADTFLTVWPTGTTRPLASNVNLARARTNPNLATVTLGAGRKISVYNNAGVIDVLVDLAGFYSPEFGAAFVPVTPSRVFDTRDGTGTFLNEVGPLTAAEHATVHPSETAVPADAVAVAVNLTGITPTASTFVTAWHRFWDSDPTTSNLNLVPGQIAANLAVLPTRHEYPGQGFYLYNRAGETHVAADLAGYFVVPPAPCATNCAYAWGGNDGDAGVGTTTKWATPPAQVRGLSDVVAVSSHYAVRSNGTVWAWGNNQTGQLGNGWTGGESPVPVRVTGLTGVVSVAETWRSGFALRSDGTVWGWGGNWSGLLGDPGQRDTNVPIRLPDLSGITAIAAGNSTAYALRTDGTILAWGGNDYGQLGNGSTVYSTWDPVQVTGLTGVTTITAGYQNAAAIRADGTVWTWGRNNEHQLGNGTDVPESRVPVQVSGLTGATDVSMAIQHGYAVRSDGTVWAWGDNHFGGLGNGVACDWVEAPECESNVPVQVSNLTGAVAVADMINAGAALTADGHVWVWGANNSGEFGNGTVTDGGEYAVVPQQVPGLADVNTLEAGYFGARALVSGPA